MRKIPANRMELLRLNKRKILAQKGYQLLEDKLENLLVTFHRLIEDFKKIQAEAINIFNDFLEDLTILKVLAGENHLSRLFTSLPKIDLKIETQRLFNFYLIRFDFEEKKENQLDIEGSILWSNLRQKSYKVLKTLLKLSQFYLNLKKISEEIMRTRRRTNALQYVLIPYLENSIKFIESRLSELEREFIVQISRIKDLIRG